MSCPSGASTEPGPSTRRPSGWAGSPTKLRKARQFAHRAEGHSRERLDALCRLLREHRPIFGIAHVGLLVTVVPWPEREAIQKECIEGNWSTYELQAEIKKRYGARRQGGRRRQVPAEPGHVLFQIAEMADTWLRWYAVVTEGEEEHKSSRDKGHESAARGCPGQAGCNPRQEGVGQVTPSFKKCFLSCSGERRRSCPFLSPLAGQPCSSTVGPFPLIGTTEISRKCGSPALPGFGRDQRPKVRPRDAWRLFRAWQGRESPAARRVTTMHRSVRVLAALPLLLLAGFSVFGFLATYEPPGWPVLRAAYAVTGLLSLGGAAWVALARKHPPQP